MRVALTKAVAHSRILLLDSFLEGCSGNRPCSKGTSIPYLAIRVNRASHLKVADYRPLRAPRYFPLTLFEHECVLSSRPHAVWNIILYAWVRRRLQRVVTRRKEC
jgi:hypothetical protein